MKILLQVAYLGTAYCGFQVQKNGLSVQQVLQDAVEAVYGTRYPLTGCSRTDSGVHAKMFFCTVDAGEKCSRIPMSSLPQALNRRLPQDVAVMGAGLVSDAFHPRYDVLRKEYVYHIWNRPEPNPFLAGRAWHYFRKLNVAEMDRAARAFVGEHDFAGFMSAGSSVQDTVRRIDTCSVQDDGKGNVFVTVSANGFLYNMVRIIVGTLVAVSEGRLRADDIPEILLSKDRTRAGSTAPAHGLYLNRVEYPEDVLPGGINDLFSGRV